MEGYNPSVSLLPQGSGVITPMSGGGAPPGYDPSVSLLPQVDATIGLYKGGAAALAKEFLPIDIVESIQNDGTDGTNDFRNQCMLISIMDHLR
jgi:hypothetical protein